MDSGPVLRVQEQVFGVSMALTLLRACAVWHDVHIFLYATQTIPFSFPPLSPANDAQVDWTGSDYVVNFFPLFCVAS